jgi:hypothetical protein
MNTDKHSPTGGFHEGGPKPARASHAGGGVPHPLFLVRPALRMGLGVVLLGLAGLAQAQIPGTRSATSTLVVKVPPRSHVIAPQTISTLASVSGSNLQAEGGLIEIAMRTTRAIGNGIVTAEWSAPGARALPCVSDSLRAAVSGRALSVSAVARLGPVKISPGPRRLKLSFSWDPQMPYRDQWASLTRPNLPPPTLPRFYQAELAAERTVTPGIAVPVLAVRPGCVLAEGRFYASASFPPSDSVSPLANAGTLTLTVTEY